MSDDFDCKSLTKQQRATCCPNEICLCDEEDQAYEEFMEDNFEEGFREND